MNSTSNINDLPNSFVGGGSNESNQIYNSNIKLDTAEIPRANIPLSTEKISTDEQVKVNFVPETENNVYYFNSNDECNSLITEIIIPSSVESINISKFAFVDFYNLRKVIFNRDSNLRIIPSSAFAYCESLEEIELPVSTL